MRKDAKNTWRNLAAKHGMKYNRAVTMRDRKNDYRRNKKHKQREHDNEE